MPEEFDGFEGVDDSPKHENDLSSSLKPITERQIKKAKRTRATLITIILLAVIALGALVYVGYLVFGDGIRQVVTGEEDTNGSTGWLLPSLGRVSPTAMSTLRGRLRRCRLNPSSSRTS